MSRIAAWMEDWLPSAPVGWSDLFLRVGDAPVVKIGDMSLAPAEGAPEVTPDDLSGLLEREVDWSKPVDIDRGVTLAGVRFRLNAFRAGAASGIVMRRLGDRVPELDSLGLPDAVLRKKVGQSQGLVIIAGETGSGKTTTLAALMADRARQYSSTTITIEDPVEIILPRTVESAGGRLSLFIQREVGTDTPSFASGLRAALREAPNVITVGEIRDRESARLALQGAETGHLVFATLHTRSAAETVARLLAFFPPDEHQLVRGQLAAELILVMRQVLMPAADGSGRVPAYELMTLDGEVPAVIRKARDEQILNAIRQGGGFGMIALNDMLARLVKGGKVTVAEAMRHSYDVDELQGRV